MPTIAVWNINGLRAVVRKGSLVEAIAEMKEPEVFGLNEIKASDPEEAIKRSIIKRIYPYRYWSPAEKPGYAGVGLLCKEQPVRLWTKFIQNVRGPDEDYEEKEGRIITAEFIEYIVVCVYTPNVGRHNREPTSAHEFKANYWFPSLMLHLGELEKTNKPVFLMGDLNVVASKQDFYVRGGIVENEEGYFYRSGTACEQNMSGGWSYPEQRGFKQLCTRYTDLVNTEIAPELNYSWWDYQTRARRRNDGWRIDYIMVCSEYNTIGQTTTYQTILGSDHCPLSLTF